MAVAGLRRRTAAQRGHALVRRRRGCDRLSSSLRSAGPASRPAAVSTATTSWPRLRSTGMICAALAMETSRSSLVPPNNTAIFMRRRYHDPRQDQLRRRRQFLRLHGSSFSRSRRSVSTRCGRRDSGWRRQSAAEVTPVVTPNAAAPNAPRHGHLHHRIVADRSHAAHRHTETLRHELIAWREGLPVRIIGARVTRRMAPIMA